MKANELRIGNWVMYSSKIQVNENKIRECVDYPDRFAPIPLTEEWLERFGFIRQGNRNMWVKDKLCIDLKELPNIRGEFIEGWYIGLKDLGNVLFHSFMNIEHVNQLQNLYHALTGEELQTDETEQKVN